MFDHEADGDFMLRPLAKSGFLTSAPLTAAVTTPDIGVPRCHIPIAGQTAAQPRQTRAGIRLQRHKTGSPHQVGSPLTIEANRLPGRLQRAVPTACAPADGCITRSDLVLAAVTPAPPRLAGARVWFERNEAGRAHHDLGGDRIDLASSAVSARGMASTHVAKLGRHFVTAGQAPTPPGRLRVLVRLDRLNPSSPHNRGRGFTIQAPGHGIAIPNAPR
jgi:hypothetical protein